MTRLRREARWVLGFRPRGGRALLGLGMLGCAACTSLLGDFSATTSDGGTSSDAGNSDATDAQTDAGPSGFVASQVSAGEHHTCAVKAGRVYCWGLNDKGQLGIDPAGVTSNIPRIIGGLGEGGGTNGILAVAAGYKHTCAIDGLGSVFCWGLNDRGQTALPTIDTAAHYIPTKVPGLLSSVSTLSATDGNTCALTSGGGLYCWGDNNARQFGVVTPPQPSAPMDVGSYGALTVAAGPRHTCIFVGSNSSVRCWGTQSSGEIGMNADGGPSPFLPNAMSSTEKVLLSGAGNSVAVGEAHSCASASQGAQCWGNNTYGQVAAMGTAPVFVPTAVGTVTGIDVVAAGGNFSCALKVDKTVICWGRNEHGQLGRGGTGKGDVNPEPVAVVGLMSVRQVSLGVSHACAVTGAGPAPGPVLCWGNVTDNRLGLGGSNVDDQTSPQPVHVE